MPEARSIFGRVAGSQPVVDTDFRDQLLRANRVGFQLVAQLLHVDAQVVRITFVAGSPDSASN